MGFPHKARDSFIRDAVDAEGDHLFLERRGGLGEQDRKFPGAGDEPDRRIVFGFIPKQRPALSPGAPRRAWIFPRKRSNGS